MSRFKTYGVSFSGQEDLLEAGIRRAKRCKMPDPGRLAAQNRPILA